MSFTPQSSERFAQVIEHRVATARIPYREAVLEFCETRGLEPEQVVKLLSPKILGAITAEAQSLHLIRREASLPL
jgi:hypothetical protein